MMTGKKHLLSILVIVNLITNLLSINPVIINPLTRQFVDEHNRTIVFHGVNVVYKLSPFIPTKDKFDAMNSFSKEDITFLKDYGFNLVRLGLTWESVERNRGEYNGDHVNEIREIVEVLEKNDIYVIIDAHQDMFSRIFCGEGVPTFYAKELFYEKECKTNVVSEFLKLVGGCIPLETFNWEYDDDGLPNLEQCKTGFMKFHQSPELTTIYNTFYNDNDIQEKFIKFWQFVAMKFVENKPKNIIGYDLWNEPWPGNLWSDVRGWVPGEADRTQVLPFYKKLDKGIREIDTHYTSFFESVPFPDVLPFFGGKAVGAFNETPAGEDHLDKQVLNFHSYCCAASGDMCAKGEPSLEAAMTVCKKFHMNKIAAHVQTSEKLKVPYMVTEFGACSDSEACYQELLAFVQAAEEYNTSWAYWMYKPFGDHTTTARENTEGMFYITDNLVPKPQPFKVKALTRPYIKAYQGLPIRSSFNSEISHFKSIFKLNTYIKQPSVLYFNQEEFYKTGPVLKISDKNGKIIDFKKSEEDLRVDYGYKGEESINTNSNQISFYIEDERYHDLEITVELSLV